VHRPGLRLTKRHPLLDQRPAVRNRRVPLVRAIRAVGKRIDEVEQKKSYDEAVARATLDNSDGVFWVWDDLRLSSTQLILAYHSNAQRYSLAGATATVEDTGAMIVKPYPVRGNPFNTTTIDTRQVHIAIEGPQIDYFRTVNLSDNPDAFAQAREFAAKLNRASRQLQG